MEMIVKPKVVEEMKVNQIQIPNHKPVVGQPLKLNHASKNMVQQIPSRLSLRKLIILLEKLLIVNTIGAEYPVN